MSYDDLDGWIVSFSQQYIYSFNQTNSNCMMVSVVRAWYNIYPVDCDVSIITWGYDVLYIVCHESLWYTSFETKRRCT